MHRLHGLHGVRGSKARVQFNLANVYLQASLGWHCTFAVWRKDACLSGSVLGLVLGVSGKTLPEMLALNPTEISRCHLVCLVQLQAGCHPTGEVPWNFKPHKVFSTGYASPRALPGLGLR